MDAAGVKTAVPETEAAALGVADVPGDQALVKELRGAKAEAALGELLRRHGPMVLRAARRITGDEHRAEDVLQAAFLILYQKAAGLESVGSLGGWLYRVAVLSARESLRAEARRKRRENAVAKSADLETSQAPVQLPAGFDAALERLPLAYREVIVLRFLRGLSLEEAAAELNVQPGTVATRTTRALERLRKALGVSAGAYAGSLLLQALSTEAAQAAATSIQASQIASITAACLQGASVGGGVALAKAVKSSLLYAKLKFAVAAVVAMAAAGAVTVAVVPNNAPEDQPPATFAAAEQVPGAAICFSANASSSAALSDEMAAWKEDERQRRGAAFAGSHAWWPWGLRVFDYDRDGRPDLVVSHMGAPGSRIFHNQTGPGGTMTFANANPALGLKSPALAGGFLPDVIDLDGDGWLDLVFRDTARSNCFQNRQGRGFEPANLGIGSHEAFQRIEDLDRDGYLDLLCEHARFRFDPQSRQYKSEAWTHPAKARVPRESAAWLEAEEAKPSQRFLSLVWRDDIDLDGDGRLDAYCTGMGSYQSSSFTRYFLSDERGNLRDATAELGLPSDGAAVFAGDLTGDGRLAVCISNGAAPGYYLRQGKRFERQAGPLTERMRYHAPVPYTIRLADFNDDGRPDVLLTAGRWNSLVVFENAGNGVFREAFRAPCWDGEAVQCADLDGDGRLDLIAGGPGDRVTVYVNATPDPGHHASISPRMSAPNPYAVGAEVEVFAPGGLDLPGAKPVFHARAEAAGLPLHAGLGQAQTFDLRIRFPGKDARVVEKRALQADTHWIVDETGQSQLQNP